MRLRVALAVGAAVLLTGCSTGTGAAPPEGGNPTTLPSATSAAGDEPASDPALARFYDQAPVWKGCGDQLECTDVTVPVDWATPDGATLELAVVRLLASGDRVGSLLVNPGGPGASGVSFVTESGRDTTTAGLREAYDIVGFDPRGVGASEPVDCLDDAAFDDFLAYDPDPQTPDGLAELQQEATGFAAACAADAGALLAHVDTVSAAQDVDVLRAVVGDERLTYLGKSYGTLLGATYADLFPQRVGRLVLDGALDPASGYVDVVVGQAGGLEQALRAYVTDCLERDGCPLRGSVDEAVEQVRSVLRQAEESPLRTDDPDRPLTAPLAVNGVVTPLYESAAWTLLDVGLEGGLSGDGTALLALADLYADRGEDGAYGSNLLEAFSAVNCLDYPVDASPAALAAAEAELVAASPTFGPALAYGEVLCSVWPVPPVRTPAPLDAEGAPPVLVVGTTGDPATPYAWSEALAAQLSAGRLLTWEGEGHTAYRRGSACVDAAVDAYLVDGVLPGDGATCRD